MGSLVFTTPSNRAMYSRMAKAGEALRLTSGAYVVGGQLPIDALVRHHRFALIARRWPDAVLCGRTALAGAEPVNGVMYVAHPDPATRSDLVLPGLRVKVQTGPGHLPGDMSLPNGLWLAGAVRGFIENVNLPGRPLSSRAGTAAVEDAIEELARTGGAGKIRSALNELDVVEGSFDTSAVAVVRERLTAVLGSFSTNTRITSKQLSARLAGIPYDRHRLRLLDGVIKNLSHRAPDPRHALGGANRWEWLPFFEAYFSNYIEGTVFSLEEARDIAINGKIPAARPEDAHDVSATFRLTSDPTERGQVPKTTDEFVDILRERHAVLMAARPDKHPGEFKTVTNYAGGYQFVDPALVEGTLREGFKSMERVVDPFARAVAMMVLVTECHPFDDGNGRIARIMSNSELTSAGQIRFVIPNVFRNNYLAALNGLSSGAGQGQALISVLDFAQRWTAAIRWQSYEAARADIDKSNGFLDPGIGESSGQRLRLPSVTE